MGRGWTFEGKESSKEMNGGYFEKAHGPSAVLPSSTILNVIESPAMVH